MVVYKRMLLTRPTFYDIVTPLSNYASVLVESAVKSKGVEVKALGEDIYWIQKQPVPPNVTPSTPANTCTRAMFESSIRGFDPIFYANFGHGDKECIVSTDNCLVDTLNMSLLKDRVVYAFSCLTASGLGPKAIKAGCKTYVGWTAEIWAVFYEEAPGIYRPAEGNVETMGKFPVEFASGITAKEAFQKAIEEYDKWINYWKGKDPNCYSQFSWNKQHLVLLGSEEERIISPLEYQLNMMMTQFVPFLIVALLMMLMQSIIASMTEFS